MRRDDTQDLTCIRRTALIVWRLAQGDSLSILDVMRLTGLTRQGAHYMMIAMSQVIPLYDQDGTWMTATAAQGE